MPLVSVSGAELAFGHHPLLDGADLVVQDGERIGLIGRNGTGKSSLLKALAGEIALDDGRIQRSDALAITLVEQEPVLPAASTLRESLAIRGRLDAIADERERWRAEARLVEFLHRLGLDEAADPATASGGERKRAALALAFATAPDLLLLDEPTNHLDIDGIEQVEDLLARGPASIVITHDRAFLDRVATRIVELDRGMLRSYPGNFAAYERRKRDELAAEAIVARKFDRYWAQEEAWIRKGVEARRTRDMGRVRRLDQLRADRAARRERIGQVKLALDAGERSGKLVAELERVTQSFGDRVLVRDLTTVVMRGDRIGLIGPNGAGKSTLLKLMLGAIAPDSGKVRLGTKLSVAYFDQLRETLDPERTLADTIAPGADWVETAQGRRHVLTYLGDFLFPPERASAPVRTLSGGERNRLLLARLFALPANLLVLDEPTNDLDIDTLELLEATLQGYDGTLVVVSHDRAFLDNVVTQTLVAEGDGVWREYAGGYTDWIAQRGERTGVAASRSRAAEAAGSARTPAAAARDAGRDAGQGSGGARPRAKLSYKEQRELESLPAEIEALEREQHEITARVCAPDYHRQGADAVRRDRARAEEVEHLLAAKIERWVALEEAVAAAKGGGG
ncbi:MAG: ATP-binding cassette domain-containing protein [Burkholderiales bacterium]|nr:ATP-binding cassette domain-containing protein [Burkholderiales bacterium]